MPATFQGLISVSELQNSLSDPKLRIIDCRFRLMEQDWGLAVYQRSHISGAVYAHLDRDLAGPVTAISGRHPLPAKSHFLQRLARWGIKSDTRIVCYDHEGGVLAVRLWWMLRHWLGFEQVQVLNGGWSAWLEHAGDLESGDALTPEVQPMTCETDQNSWLSTARIVANLEAGEYRLLDARSSERFAGLQEPIDTVAGHIPLALNRPLTENLTGKAFFKPAAQLRDEFSALLHGRVRPEQVVHTCGSGVTACHNLFAMELAGLSGSKLYPGSWSEWIRDPKRPIVSTPSATHPEWV